MNLGKQEKLRIVFMGTPDFAVATLETLIENDYDVVGVITAPDRPAGRGRKLQESTVKKYALKMGLPILQPTNLKNDEFLTELSGWRANLQIVVAFRMLPRAVWQMPRLGTFNLHASLLPNYRGAAPINWAIMNGETETGVTTFFIDDKIDTGEIILQEKIGITEDDTAGSLHNKLMKAGAALVLTTVEKIGTRQVETYKQEGTEKLKSAYKIYKDTCEVDWKKPIGDVYNHIRGLSPYPASWTTLYNGEDILALKIYRVAKEHEKHDLAVGTVVFDKTELKIAVDLGYISLLEIQLSGKRKMKTADVLNGLKLQKSAYVA